MNYRCRYLAHGLYFSFNCLRHCHLSIHAPEYRELYNYIVPYRGPKDKINWERVFSIKKKLVQDMKNGDIPCFCKGCHWIEEFDENSEEQFLSDFEPYIDMIWLGHFNDCNAKCIYCMSFEAISKNKMTKDYGVHVVLKEMLDKKIYNLEKNPKAHLSFSMGEPTLLKDFDSLINMFVKKGNKHFAIYTNAIKHSKMLEKLLKQDDVRISIVVSLDSGSREIYKKVKLVDKFDDVCKNIKKYALAANSANPVAVGVKYIIIPKINDTIEEIDKFFDLCVGKLGVKYLMADIEENWYVRNNAQVPEYIKDLLRHIKTRCEEHNINFEYYDRAYVTKL